MEYRLPAMFCLIPKLKAMYYNYILMTVDYYVSMACAEAMKSRAALL